MGVKHVKDFSIIEVEFMKAVRFLKPDSLELAEVPMPELAEGEALIKVLYSGICGSDVHVFQGHHPTACYPVTPGHEFVGELVKVHDSSRSDLQPGTLVAAQPYYACGICEACLTGHENVCRSLKIHGIHHDGSFAEYVKVLARKVYTLPQDLDPQLAALIEPLSVAVHDVRKSGLKVGENCLIIGGGPIGLLIAMVARLSGAGRILISEVSPARVAFAERLGFETINPVNSDLKEKTAEVTNKKGFDVVFEVSGSKAGTAAMTDAAKIAGTIVIVGMAADSYPVNTTQVFIKELKLRGVRIHSQVNFAAAIDILKSGRINEELRSLVSAVYPLSEAAAAFETAIKSQDVFKILVSI